MPKVRHIEETDLTKDEVELLARLLQGMARKNLKAGVKLVFRGWASWREPDGELVLTDLGIKSARQLWPGLDENPQGLAGPSVVADSHVAREEHQLQLAVPPLVGDPDGLRRALAEVIGDGQKGDELALALLEHYPQGRGLPTATTAAMVAVGLPEGAAERVRQAFVLARACRRKNERWGKWIRSAQDMAEAVFERFGVADLEVEHLWAGAIDSSESLIDVFPVAQGALSYVNISMREVFTPLCRARAAACFVAHNHPSCDLRFSNDDLRLTQRIIACGVSMEITVLDHIVLAPDGRFASLRDEGGIA